MTRSQYHDRQFWRWLGRSVVALLVTFLIVNDPDKGIRSLMPLGAGLTCWGMVMAYLHYFLEEACTDENSCDADHD